MLCLEIITEDRGSSMVSETLVFYHTTARRYIQKTSTWILEAFSTRKQFSSLK